MKLIANRGDGTGGIELVGLVELVGRFATLRTLPFQVAAQQLVGKLKSRADLVLYLAPDRGAGFAEPVANDHALQRNQGGGKSFWHSHQKKPLNGGGVTVTVGPSPAENDGVSRQSERPGSFVGVAGGLEFFVQRCADCSDAVSLARTVWMRVGVLPEVASALLVATEQPMQSAEVFQLHAAKTGKGRDRQAEIDKVVEKIGQPARLEKNAKVDWSSPQTCQAFMTALGDLQAADAKLESALDEIAKAWNCGKGSSLRKRITECKRKLEEGQQKGRAA